MRLVVLTAAVVLGLLVAPQALAATFTVTTAADSGAGSLRQAILDANALAGLDTIDFAIPGAGEHTIQPVTGLPTITDAVVIDGSGQVDGNGRPLVRIDGGAGTAPSLYGLDFAVPTIAPSSLVRLAFTRWDNGNGAGVRIGSAGTVSVTGSLFGTTASGATSQDAVSLGSSSGIQVENDSTIGGIAAVDRNVISGNALNGIYVAGGPAVITGNWIGVGVDGTTALGNGSRGVFVQAADAEIGGVGTGEGNVIHNNGVGVEIIAGSSGVRVQGNSIRDNAGLGIDLAPSGVTANDAGDADAGPNGLQNFPVITSAVQSGGMLTVGGTLDSVDGPPYAVAFYVSASCDASGNGEGETFIGFAGEVGSAFSGVSFPLPGGSPSVVTATATGPDGTSEFSACVSIENGGSLTGSRATSPPNVDLTSEGTEDWAVWGFSSDGSQCTTDGSCSTSLPPDVRKTGGSAISNLVNVNPGAQIPLRGLGFVSGQPFVFSWSDGAPIASATGARTGLQHNGGEPTNASTLGTGFSFTVPADTTPRTLNVWVALNRAGGQLTATLSDGSAASFGDSYNVGTSDFVGAVYTLTYRAASAGQTLTVAWVENVDSCPAFRCDNVSIHAVALSGGGPSLVVTNTNDSGAGSLRQAITNANAQPGLDTITFNIPGTGPHVINALTGLPDTGDVVVDGTTQLGYAPAATPVVEVRGPGGISQGFFGAGDNVTVKGLSITNWNTGVALLGTGSIQDSWLGIEPGGALRPNVSVGVLLEGSGASVVRSQIAGGRCGVFITASTNGGCGITPGNVQAGSGNTIGGDASTGAGNTIYGFTVAGVYVSGAGAGNTIQGNVIGLTPAGSPSGGGNGVFIRDALGTVVGADAYPNDLFILNPNLGNVVAGITTNDGNSGIAVVGASSGTRITANSVGTNRAGTAIAVGVAGPGVSVVGASGIQIGPGNKIAHNTGVGVDVADGTGNRIVANSIHDNGGDGGGIRLTNANAGLAPPVITSATNAAGTTTVSGTVTGPGGASYFVELFSNGACDAPGVGEGKTYVTFVSVGIPGGPGPASAPFSADLTGIPTGTQLTATLTGASTNNTSAFSNCLSTTSATPPAVTNLTISGPATADAGAPAVPLLSIPPAALVVPQTSGTQAAPVNQSPVNQSPVNQLPVNQLPVNQSPVNQSPVNQLPVNQSPVNQSGLGLSFSALAQAPGPLGDTALSTIPLLREGGWGAILPPPLSATPLQSVTLRQAFSLNPLPVPLQPGATSPIRFADIDFSNSPLGSLPAMTLALGQLPVSGIPGVDWCALFSGPPLNCSGSLPGSTSLLSAALEGAPVNQSPVNQSPVNQSLIDALATAQAPVNQLPVNQLPVNQLPVNQLPVNQSRILSLPVNQLPVNQSPVNQLSLAAILAANAPVSQSPVNQLPVNQLPVNQSVLVCSGQCTGTLGDYVGNVLPGVTLGDLRQALPGDLPDDWTIANLEDFANLIVGDLLASLPQPNDLTLADVLALALLANNPESFAFETLNIFDTGLPLYADPPATAPYSVAFTLDPNGGATGGPSTVAVSVTLPRTFAYAPGTSKLVTGSGCGSGTAVTDPALTQVASGVTKATWSVSGVVGSSYTLCFSARPGIVLGPQSATAAATPAGGATVSAASPEPVTVVDGSESGNNTPGTSPLLTTSKLYLSYLTSAADVDYYRVEVPAVGSRTTFYLSHLPGDYDLVIYGPEQTALRTASPSTPPLDGAPVTDTGSELTHVTDALPSQTLDDLRLQALPVVGVSASRGTDPEDITVLSDGSGGSYTVQVTSYNGATSADPYMLRVTSEAPRVDVTTPSRSVSGTAANTLVGALPTGFNTLFLVNRQRLESGATSVLAAITANQASFSSLGFPNTVLFVDAYPAVQAAYSNWDADPGDPDLANKVVAAINGIVDSEVRAKPNGAGLEYLVIVGGDSVIPQGRLGDFTTVANESGYAETFDRTSDLFATLHAGQMLSDDPYGTLEPVPYLNRQLYVPRLSVGRLVETPEEIVATLNRFTSFSGRLDPATSLVTGYDFMRDGAAAINAPFAGRFGAGAATLPSPILTGPEDWTRATLLGAFLPAAGAPAITSLNGHADHFQFAPPSPLPPFFTTADLPLGPAQPPAGATGPLANRLVFSMGCHGGLSVSDAVVTGNTFDWPQAYSRNGVGAYLGNTGYGYGDSLVIAYSELLDSIFAQKIAAGATVGNALAAAKQEYFGSLGVFGVYDEKAMAEFTLYGLPMWSVTTPDGGATPASATPAPAAQSGGVQMLSLQATAAVPTSTSIVTDTATGLQAEAFTLDAIANTETSTALGRFWSGPDGVQSTHFRPLQPKAFVEVTGTSGHGALITELRQQADIPGVDPVFARPIVDTEDTEPELSFGDVAFPARLQALRTFTRDGATAQRVVLMTGQFFTGANPGVTGQGVQRLYTRIGARVLRSSSNDFTPPAFTRIEATKVSGNAAFSVDVTDLGGAAQVKRVLVALRSGADTTWKFSDLGQVGTSSTWSGGVPLTSPADEFEYFVQAVDAAGNVGVTTNKGFFFAAATPPAPTGDVTVAPAAPVPPSGWFAGSTDVVANGPDGVTLEVSVDGGAFTPVAQGGGPTINGDGVHTVQARGSNGGTAGTVVAIDAGNPEITIATPAPGASYRKGSSPTADFTCADAGSGVASCTGTIASGAPISTATTGAKTFTVNATDNVGKTATKSVTYTVFEPCALPAPAGAIVRGSGNDTINGTPGNDVIYDIGGNNKIDGKGGNDIICSGTGNDTITTGGGDDIVIDTGGNNTVDTGGGNDEISTRTGNDKITAGAGNDIVTDTGGNTTIDAGSGDDDVTSGRGNDKITTGAGNDVVDDAGGNNTIDTGAGNDEVSTGTGNDKITAGDGDDVIADTGGNNNVDLGGGFDTVTTAAGNDTIEGGADDDTIDAGNGNNNVNGGSGNDRITTGSGNDTIDGGPGYDVCKPGSGSNSVTNCEV